MPIRKAAKKSFRIILFFGRKKELLHRTSSYFHRCFVCFFHSETFNVIRCALVVEYHLSVKTLAISCFQEWLWILTLFLTCQISIGSLNNLLQVTIQSSKKDNVQNRIETRSSMFRFSIIPFRASLSHLLLPSFSLHCHSYAWHKDENQILTKN